MPLQLGGIDTMRKQTVVWDPNSPEEVKEAENKLKELEKLGFIVTDIVSDTDGHITLFPPARNKNIGVFRIISQNGDDRVIWDRRSPDEVKEAFQKFKELMQKGYAAYASTSDGIKGHKITEFDPGLEEVIFVPATKPG